MYFFGSFGSWSLSLHRFPGFCLCLVNNRIQSIKWSYDIVMFLFLTVQYELIIELPFSSSDLVFQIASANSIIYCYSRNRKECYLLNDAMLISDWWTECTPCQTFFQPRLGMLGLPIDCHFHYTVHTFCFIVCPQFVGAQTSICCIYKLSNYWFKTLFGVF